MTFSMAPIAPIVGEDLSPELVPDKFKWHRIWLERAASTAQSTSISERGSAVITWQIVFRSPKARSSRELGNARCSTHCPAGASVVP